MSVCNRCGYNAQARGPCEQCRGPAGIVVRSSPLAETTDELLIDQLRAELELARMVIDLAARDLAAVTHYDIPRLADLVAVKAHWYARARELGW